MTVRQVHQLSNGYREDGPAGPVPRRRGKPSNNRKASDISAAVLSIIRDRYADFGSTFACEKQREQHGLVLSKETVRKLMLDAGIWISRQLRSAAIYQPCNDGD